MERVKIKMLEIYRGKKSTTFTGRPQGEQVRLKMNLNELDIDSKEYVIVFPANTTSINPSFYLGLFFNSVKNLNGLECFKQKYQFEFEDKDNELVALLREDIADCERQAYNEFRRSKLK